MRRFLLSAFFLSLVTLQAQVVAPGVCTVTAVPVALRAEGVTERIGDIVLTCTGTPDSGLSGNLGLSLSNPITNRSDGGGIDAILTIDSGTGPIISTQTPTLLGINQIVFTGLNLAFGAQGGLTLRITNVRVNVSISPQNVTAQLSFSGPGLPSTVASMVTVGVPQRGLLASSVTPLVCSQAGSPLPDVLGFAELIAAGTTFSSVRVTEGLPAALQPRQPLTDVGTRVVIRYTNVPADARMFVPDFIAGNDAAKPTVAGDYGGGASGGQYTPGKLLLSRVLGADVNGVGGFAGSSGSAVFNSVSEIAVANGAAFAVFEVVEADGQTIESAQIPTFLGLPRSINERTVEIGRIVALGPVASSTSTLAQPIPRFSGIAPDNDCIVRGDCSSLIPKLAVPFADPLSFTVPQGAALRAGRIYVENAGGGRLVFSARVEYKGGQTGWIRLTQETNSVYVLLMIPGLVPGTYQADVVVDAGSAGVQRLPVSLTINPAAPAKPTISSVVNGASFSGGSLAAGSLATIKGSGFDAPNVSVAVDELTAKVLYSSASQINFQIPAEAASRQSVKVAVTASGQISDSVTVNLAPSAPGIFAILNQDNSANSATNPARAGTVMQIFITGLLSPDGSGTVDYKLHDMTSSQVAFSGPAPGLPGVQQVNIALPDYWPTMTSTVSVCSTVNSQRACSPAVPITSMQK